MNGELGQNLGCGIVEAHEGKIGLALAIDLLAKIDAALAGRLAGSQIVSVYGGTTGAGLAGLMQPAYRNAAAA